MAFTHVQSKVYYGTGTGVNSLSLPSAATAGNLVVAAISIAAPGYTNSWPTVTATFGGNAMQFTPTQSCYNAPSAGAVGIAWIIAPSSGISGVTVDVSFPGYDVPSYNIGLQVHEFATGGAQVSFDKDAAGYGNAATIGSPSITPTSTGELLFAFAGSTGTISATNSPWTDGGTDTGYHYERSGYILSSASGSTAASFTQSGTWNSLIAAFTPSSVSASATPAAVGASFTVSTPTASGTVSSQFTYAQHAYNRGNTYSLSCSLPNTPTAGNLIAVGIDFENYSGSGPVPSLSVVDGNGYAYNLVSSPLAWVAGDNFAAVAWGIVPNNPSKTLVVSTSTSYTATPEIAANVYEFNTGGAAVYLDTYAAGSGSATSTITAPAVTPSGAGELLIAFGDPGNVAISAVNSPWTTADTLSNGFAVLAYDLCSTSGSTAANFTLSSGTNSYWGCIVAAFKVNANTGSTPNTDRATFSVSHPAVNGTASVSVTTLQIASHVNIQAGVSGAFGFVQSSVFACNPATGYGSGTLPNAPTKGNLIVIGVLFKNGTNMWPGASITACGQGCCFAPAQAYSVGSTAGSLALAWCVVPGNPSNTFTATFSTLGFSQAACYVCEFSVGGNYPYLDTGAALGYAGTTINAPGITPANIGELLIAFGSANQTINAPGSPWSDGGQGDVDGTRMSYSLSSGYGTTYPSMPLSLLGTWSCVTAAFYLSGVPVVAYPSTVGMSSSVSTLAVSGSANTAIGSVSSTFSLSTLTSTGTANVSLSTLTVASVIEGVGGSVNGGRQVSTVSAASSVTAVLVEADSNAAASPLSMVTSPGSPGVIGNVTASVMTLTIRTEAGFVVGGVWDRDLLPAINGAVTTIARLQVASAGTPSAMVLGTPTQINLLKIGSITAVSI